ncbi:hypothetical protein EJB05_02165, partial [Eragrostis curvula]
MAAGVWNGMRHRAGEPQAAAHKTSISSRGGLSDMRNSGTSRSEGARAQSNGSHIGGLHQEGSYGTYLSYEQAPLKWQQQLHAEPVVQKKKTRRVLSE